MIELDAHDSRWSVNLGVDPEHGGRLATFTLNGRDLLVGPGSDRGPMTWGCYPMVPYAGRVRRGRFSFRGKEYQLPVTLPPHAIHGVGYLQPWTVDAHTVGVCELSCSLAAEWPFGGSAYQSIRLRPDSLRLTLRVRAGARAMPAQVGWHPWFTKAALSFTAEQMYERDDEAMPTGRLVEVPSGPWDDCFAGLHPPVVLGYPGFRLELRSDCARWVVYDEPGHATCVEPQSGPPDGFTLEPDVLEPGEELTRWFEITWSTGPGASS